MSEYNVYPAVDINNAFPPPVREAIAASTEVQEVVDNTVGAAVATKANTADTYSKLETNNAISTAIQPKANSADVYTKTESDAKYALKGEGGGTGSGTTFVVSDTAPTDTTAIWLDTSGA